MCHWLLLCNISAVGVMTESLNCSHITGR
ncbi:hypothetical protein [Escherichia coli]|nr:hypothetical protein [Escherichia coli]MCY0185859.1 hypothetical protein [Escherichia coli]